ncbi:MAG TPA: NAD(P) transhydrogenase subunit alpha [Flavobacteriaceae bacterium]|nr:NAD(P) transhydrogenase subunit alpha [Flavobacteriaceae bacterium]
MEFIQNNLEQIYFIILCAFIGIEIISNVPAILHTPLMSGANAISGIILVGAIIIMLDIEPTDYLNLTLGGIAVFMGTLNVSGGFFITGRMLKMFNTKKNNQK